MFVRRSTGKLMVGHTNSNFFMQAAVSAFAKPRPMTNYVAQENT